MIPIHFAFVPVRAGLSVASLVVAGKRRRRGPVFSDHDVIPEKMKTDGSPTTPITDISAWEDRYVYCPLTLRRLDKNQRVIDTLEIPDAVATKVEREIKIASTEIVGADGEVFERINRGTYKVEFTFGIIAVENGQIVDRYPEEGMRSLIAFLDAGTELEVSSRFLDIFGIDRIVIEKYSTAQNTQSNYQTFSVEAEHDVIIDVANASY